MMDVNRSQGRGNRGRGRRRLLWERQVRQARIVGTTGRVDPASQKLPVVVEIPRPLCICGDRPSLLPGTLVEVFIAGAAPQDEVATPEATRASEDSSTLQDSERR